MKKLKRHTKQTHTYYKCEECGTEYGYEQEAINCEKSHTCKHEPVYDFIEASEDSWWFQVKGIQQKCKHCNKELGEIDFEDIYENQEALEAIYNIVTKGLATKD